MTAYSGNRSPWRLLRFGILGPLEIVRGDELCTPSAPKQRALLALLLIHANELVPTDKIIDELWGSCPPRSAPAALQMYVSAARRALVPNDDARGGYARRHPVLRTQPSGYVLHVEPGQADFEQFRSLAALGRRRLAEKSSEKDSGEPDNCHQAGELFRRALALWRGPALADLSRAGALDRYAERLEEERLSLTLERIGVDLCQGRGLEVVGELKDLCARHPLREGLYQQLMHALYLADRRAEALDVFATARQAMVDNVGIEPGDGLQAMQQAILRGSKPTNGVHRCQGRQ